jgi:ABC-type glycerol-3-phosphate transport system substrate-binding protein
MTYLKATAATVTMALMGGTAMAGCGIEQGSVRILANDFPALRAVSDAAAECAGDGVEVTSNHSADHKDIQVSALTANPAQYSVAVVANSSIIPLVNEGLIRPLDDLIAEHAPDLPPTNKVTIDGKVMAIAFMANAQHLFVRDDILAEAGVETPKTYDEVLAALEAIRAAGIMEYPFASNTGSGWNLAEEFVNMYLGHGGDFFVPGSAEPAINNEAGVQTLETLKALAGYSDPDFLTFDSNATQALWESGEAAIAYMWGSRGAGIIDAEGSTPEVVEATVLTAAPMVGDAGIPASSLWWDGFTIASHISDTDAEASFIAMMHGISEDVVAANNDAAVWLSPAYQPGTSATGVAATVQSGARPYPMEPYMGLMHGALGDELSAYLQGNESAEQALADVEAAYTAAAREQGFLK